MAAKTSAEAGVGVLLPGQGLSEGKHAEDHAHAMCVPGPQEYGRPLVRRGPKEAAALLRQVRPRRPRALLRDIGALSKRKRVALLCVVGDEPFTATARSWSISHAERPDDRFRVAIEPSR